MPVAIQAPRRLATHTPAAGSHGWQPVQTRPLLPRTTAPGRVEVRSRSHRPTLALLPPSAVVPAAAASAVADAAPSDTGATPFLPIPLLPPPILHALPTPVAPPEHAPIRVTPLQPEHSAGMPSTHVALSVAHHGARPLTRSERRRAESRGSAALPLALSVVGISSMVLALLAVVVFVTLR